MSQTIDLNCDMGEGMLTDEAMMPYISSANIACGYHAGNKDTMRRTIELCLLQNVKIGAHPSFLDRQNFGRSDMMTEGLTLKDVPVLIAEQLYALSNICNEMGASLHHVKPHGALYNRAVWDEELAKVICTTVYEFDPTLFFYGLAQGQMKTAAKQIGLHYVSEAFADRTYQPDGSLTPRSKSGALIEDADVALAQVVQIIKQRTVPTISGAHILLDAKTICLHGDGAHAVPFAQAIFNHLKQNDIDIEAIF